MSPDSGTLDGGGLKRVFATYLTALEEHRDFLNRVNVYPVADGDTGTNMLVTVRSALDPAGDAETVADVAKKLARGAVMGGRGNSGIILSQIVKGLLEVAARSGELGPHEFATGLDQARALAYDAVADPVEGTILTAVRAAAEAVATCDDSADLIELVDTAHRAADAAVSATTEQLEQLTRAGVVDGGAKGLALLFDAFLHELAGKAVPSPPPLPARTWDDKDAGTERWEVVLLLAADEDAVRAVKDAWAALGSSIVIVSDGTVHKCHVHTNDYEKAIEIARDAGRVSDVAVTELMPGASEASNGNRVGISGDLTPAVVELFASLDVGTGVAPVVISVDGADTAGVDHVVEVASLPQALAAALAFDPDATDENNVALMQRAAGGVTTHEARDLDDAREILSGAEAAEVATVFVGEGFDLEDIAVDLQRAAPDIAVEVYPGGRDEPAFEIGLE